MPLITFKHMNIIIIIFIQKNIYKAIVHIAFKSGGFGDLLVSEILTSKSITLQNQS